MAFPKQLFSFLILLLGTLSLFLFLHLEAQSFFGIPKWDDMLLLSYIINFFLAVSIYLTLFALRRKMKEQMGFLYLAGSLFKFLIFFLVLYPIYRMDGMLTRSEFAAFFIPYLICLILETVYTAKMLNSSD